MGVSWNIMELVPPPNRSILITNHGITDLKQICSKFQKILEDQKPLHVEAALLSRFIYRMKTKFRRDKGFQAMAKVNRCLLQYLKLNLASVYDNFTSCIRISVDGTKNNKIYAPTKQMFEYLLLRTQGFAKLISRIVELCQVGAKYLLNRIDIGHSWNMALIAISIIARIWALSKYLGFAVCEHYNKLIPFVGKLQYVGVRWTNEDIDFPENLKDWLNVEWLGRKMSYTRNPEDEHHENKSLLNKVFNNADEINNVVKTEEAKENLDFIQFKVDESVADLGERISRASFKKEHFPNGSQTSTERKVEVKKKCKKKSAFKDIKSAKDLMKFLKHEEELRINQSDTAITRSLDSFQFHLLTKRIHQLVNKLNKIDQRGNVSKFEVLLRKSRKELDVYINH